MTTIVPDVLADLIRSIMSNVPREIKWPVFSALFAFYTWAALVFVSKIWCWLDYQVATGLRRMRLAPPSLQYALGDVIEIAPRWIGCAGLAFFLITVAWAFVMFSVVPSANTPLHWFLVNWGRILQAMWS